MDAFPCLYTVGLPLSGLRRGSRRGEFSRCGTDAISRNAEQRNANSVSCELLRTAGREFYVNRVSSRNTRTSPPSRNFGSARGEIFEASRKTSPIQEDGENEGRDSRDPGSALPHILVAIFGKQPINLHAFRDRRLSAERLALAGTLRTRNSNVMECKVILQDYHARAPAQALFASNPRLFSTTSAEGEPCLSRDVRV